MPLATVPNLVGQSDTGFVTCADGAVDRVAAIPQPNTAADSPEGATLPMQAGGCRTGADCGGGAVCTEFGNGLMNSCSCGDDTRCGGVCSIILIDPQIGPKLINPTRCLPASCHEPTERCQGYPGGALLLCRSANDDCASNANCTYEACLATDHHFSCGNAHEDCDPPHPP